ncbi:hypothetical protein ACLI5Y_00480 [Enterococcus innesii]|uniref:hypothetical protein n=1 Tax=Enterococcus innesii TaxID=2839759 RepID=UPI0039851F06
MNLTSEVAKYLDFVVKNYPECTLSTLIIEDDEKFNDYFSVIRNSLQILYLLELYEDHEKISITSQFFIFKIRKSYTRFIYLYPLNEFYSIESILRQVSENVLRFCLTIHNKDKCIDDVKEMKYRNLWEDNLKKGDLYSHKNNILNYFNTQFRISSDYLHDKKEIDLLQFFECTLKQELPFDSNRLSIFNEYLRNFVLEIIVSETGINENEDYTIAQKHIIKETKKRIRKKEVFQCMNNLKISSEQY